MGWRENKFIVLERPGEPTRRLSWARSCRMGSATVHDWRHHTVTYHHRVTYNHCVWSAATSHRREGGEGDRRTLARRARKVFPSRSVMTLGPWATSFAADLTVQSVYINKPRLPASTACTNGRWTRPAILSKRVGGGGGGGGRAQDTAALATDDSSAI